MPNSTLGVREANSIVERETKRLVSAIRALTAIKKLLLDILHNWEQGAALAILDLLSARTNGVCAVLSRARRAKGPT
jgi:hypothetical protein